jgi:hypothetical protein
MEMIEVFAKGPVLLPETSKLRDREGNLLHKGKAFEALTLHKGMNSVPLDHWRYALGQDENGKPLPGGRQDIRNQLKTGRLRVKGADEGETAEAMAAGKRPCHDRGLLELDFDTAKTFIMACEDRRLLTKWNNLERKRPKVRKLIATRMGDLKGDEPEDR